MHYTVWQGSWFWKEHCNHEGDSGNTTPHQRGPPVYYRAPD